MNIFGLQLKKIKICFVHGIFRVLQKNESAYKHTRGINMLKNQKPLK